MSGIRYGAGDTRTTCAEVDYWRWRFLMDSQGLRDDALITEHTLFQARITGRQIDLASQPRSALTSLWSHPTDRLRGLR